MINYAHTAECTLPPPHPALQKHTLYTQTGRTSVDHVCTLYVCVCWSAAGWLGTPAFDLVLRGQAADGQPAGHFHLKDLRTPREHVHTAAKIPSLF